MKRSLKLTLAVASTIVSLNTAYATNVPDTSHPTTFLGPTARVGYTSTFSNAAAYSVAGEAGLKNFRIGGTIGFKLAENQLFKVSAEYLWQDVTYAFFSGNTDQWVNQGAIGAAYQYELSNYNYRPQLGVSVYGSHAPSKTLGTVNGVFLNAQNINQSFTDERRIAGSTGAGIAPSVTITPWEGGRVGLELNYDDVHYNNKYNPNEDATGFGGTAKVNQALTDNIDLGLVAAVRKPFNNYAVNLDYTNVQFYGDWTLGLFGDYTSGKDSLPNTWNAGLSANYFWDRRCPTMVPASLKGDVKAEMVAQPISDNLLAWTADPAVYMPQVLAIADGRTTLACSAGGVTLLAPIPATTTFYPSGTFVSAAASFSGSNLTYSVTTSPALPDIYGDNITINPTTGVITITNSLSSATTITVAATVTATNGCGSASTTFDVTFIGDVG